MNNQARFYLLAFLVSILCCIMFIQTRIIIQAAEDIDILKIEIKTITGVQQQVDALKEEIQITRDYIITDEPETISRGSKRLEPITMRVTAYDLSYASCKKTPDNPEYGITASGNKVREWYTIAAGPELLFGTKVFIPYFKDQPNGGVFVVQDRGSAVKENCLDVYMESNAAALEFGVQELEVYIMN